ncbi:MAG: ABC transporter permease [Trueperaceae bacterium]|nr:ABC transporter permease [Trueperaceae bacterium]
MSVPMVAAGRERKQPVFERYLNILGPLAMILALGVIMAIFEPRFFRITNIRIILQDAAIYMVLGMAMTLVITGAGIDLSIGSISALSAIVMAIFIKDLNVAVYVAMLLALIVGIGCGLVNGLIITLLRVPDLIATLSTDLVFRGLALVLAAGAVLQRFPEPIPAIGRGRILNDTIPIPIIIGVAVLLVGVFIYRYTPLGRYAIAIGGNRESAMLAGINVRRNKVYHYMLMGAAAALAGIMLTGRLNAVQATVAEGFALHTIAAVVVGGTVLFGGRGTMMGTLVGVILLSMVTNALVILRMAFFWQLVASGVIILASVAFYSYLERRGKGGSE